LLSLIVIGVMRGSAGSVPEEAVMSFTDDEVAYLRSQPLARIATVSPEGQPDASPVGFGFDGTYFYVGGHGDPAKTRKFRNVQAGNVKVALIIDDLLSTRPWAPRSMRVYGTAEIVEREGQFGPGPYLRITPTISWSSNLDGRAFGAPDFEAGPRRTVHGAPGAMDSPPASTPGGLQ
jgi:pyridoxamine 5'-phosphate oxidase family protein